MPAMPVNYLLVAMAHLRDGPPSNGLPEIISADERALADDDLQQTLRQRRCCAWDATSRRRTGTSAISV
jgi:hypothetical protein